MTISGCETYSASPYPSAPNWRSVSEPKKIEQWQLDADIAACQYEVQKVAYGAPIPGDSLGISMMGAQLDTMRLNCMRAKGWEPVWSGGN